MPHPSDSPSGDYPDDDLRSTYRDHKLKITTLAQFVYIFITEWWEGTLLLCCLFGRRSELGLGVGVASSDRRQEPTRVSPAHIRAPVTDSK
jgi:hypothetical protein